MACYAKYHKTDASVAVFDAAEVDGVTLYEIRVRVGSASWTVTHRYRDFDELHSKLVSDHGVSKELLPPKRAIRNKCPKFVEHRKQRLDAYLKDVFDYLQLAMPREFAKFLDFHHYDILFLLQDMACKFYADGDKLLLGSNYYTFNPLQLFAISERLKQPCSSFELTDRKFDFSHVLDFCSRSKNLVIEGVDKNIKNSNICPNTLPFDLTPFKSLKEVIILNIPTSLILNTGSLRCSVLKLNVHNTDVKTIRDIILCDIVHKDIAEDEDKLVWKEAVEVDFGCNQIGDIDHSIRLMPKLQNLCLKNNKISEISNLSNLPHLSHLNLSRNLFTVCEDWHSKIGKIISIDLSQNMISSLAGFCKLYSLESLDLSCNQIVDVEEVQHICKLPCLENLRLTANPVASIVDYRVKVIEQFNSRMNDICLDNEKASEKEIDTARILQALRIVKEGKTPNFFNSNNDQGFSTITAQGGCGL